MLWIVRCFSKNSFFHKIFTICFYFLLIENYINFFLQMFVLLAFLWFLLLVLFSFVIIWIWFIINYFNKVILIFKFIYSLNLKFIASIFTAYWIYFCVFNFIFFKLFMKSFFFLVRYFMFWNFLKRFKLISSWSEIFLLSS
jgi:hypothetical protein